jgi:hypothetical protein
METHNFKYKNMFNQAIEALRQTAGLDLEVVEYKPTAVQVQENAHIKIMYDNKIYDFVVAVKNVDRFATLAQVKQQLESFHQVPLLIAPNLTNATANHCQALGSKNPLI